MEKEEAKMFKILMFPWLAHGHIFPFLELAKTLSKRNFTIHFCSTAINLDSIKSNLANDPSVLDDSIKLLELEIESPELPPELHTTKNLPPHQFPLLIKDFENSKSSFFSIFDTLKPDMLIYDVFNPWAAKHALSHGSPSVWFMASGATICSFHYHQHLHKTGSLVPYEGVDFGEIKRHISPNTKGADFGGFILGSLNSSSEIILLKTSKELEKKYIDYLSFLCRKQIIPTGLLIANSDEKDEPEIMQWLDEKSERSTVYISFGSECFLSKEQIEEVAKGLELSNVNFIWIIRFPEGKNSMTVENALPEGFLERVKGRGMVIWKFAPQTRILAHKSIGGFVSHCGWSSITESVYFGVPIIAMPMKFEQVVNGVVVVEVGVGVEVEKDGSGQYLGEEVAKALDKVFGDNEFSKEVRYRASNLSDKIRENEEQEEDKVAEQLMSLCAKNKLQKCD
uniref:Glycosyltransferase n=1 Tax=Veronica persica TaxID=138560 RepID=C9K5X8_VERPE|nr:flavonoid glycosyltransferase UGT94F1 [Veronica persica]